MIKVSLHSTGMRIKADVFLCLHYISINLQLTVSKYSRNDWRITLICRKWMFVSGHEQVKASCEFCYCCCCSVSSSANHASPRQWSCDESCGVCAWRHSWEWRARRRCACVRGPSSSARGRRLFRAEDMLASSQWRDPLVEAAARFHPAKTPSNTVINDIHYIPMPIEECMILSLNIHLGFIAPQGRQVFEWLTSKFGVLL